MVTTALYRFYNRTGQLLYVGITNHLGRRFHEHGKTQPWYRDIVGSTIEHYDTRPDAELAEREAIRSEHPLHNIVHNTRTRGHSHHGYGAPIQYVIGKGPLRRVAHDLHVTRYDAHYDRADAQAMADMFWDDGARSIHLTQCQHWGQFGIIYQPAPSDPFPMHELDTNCIIAVEPYRRRGRP